MSSALISTGCARCVAFKTGPLRRARTTPQPRQLCVAFAAQFPKGASSPDSSVAASQATQRRAISEGLTEATIAALLAGGVFAGSCLAVDSPESAAQAVQVAKLAADVLRPVFSIFTMLYIIRVTMTWYPEIDGKKLPWAIAYMPTEPILSATRKVVPLVSGVDVSPIVWIGILSFLNEILLGPQGLLTLVELRGGM